MTEPKRATSIWSKLWYLLYLPFPIALGLLLVGLFFVYLASQKI